MKIVVDDAIMLRLMTIDGLYHREFSGFGFVKLEKDIIRVYDFILLDVGSEVFTEIPTKKLLELMEHPHAQDMKCWVHAHPVGDGKPGRHNWSGTDENTIQTNPLGGLPELVKWSVSMVLTPRGWVGRIDNYISKKTIHLAVEPQAPEAYDMLGKVMSSKPAQAIPVRGWDVTPPVRQYPFEPCSPRSTSSSYSFGDFEQEIWDEEEEDDIADEIWDALNECGLSLEDLAALEANSRQFYQTWLRCGQNPGDTIDDLIAQSQMQPYLSPEFEKSQKLLSGGR